MTSEAVPPVVLDESGDIELYADVGSLLSDIETIDVINGEYEAFDSRGYRLTLGVDKDREGGRVQLWRNPDIEPEPDELVRRLRRFIARVGPDRTGISGPETAPLADLIDVLSRFFRVAELPPFKGDEDVHTAVLSGLRSVPGSAYRVDQEWGSEAGLWFTEVTPLNGMAARISAAWEEGNVNATFGHSWIEVLDLEDLPLVVEAVAQGRIEEIGSADRSQARVRLSDGLMRFGHVQFPFAWRFRKVRRYEPYA